MGLNQHLLEITNIDLLGGDLADLGDKELDELERMLLQEEAELGLRDLFYFTKHILGYKDMQPKTHGPVCEYISDGGKRKHIELPRGTFKSSVITIGYTVRSIAKDSDMRVLIDNEVYNNSKGFLREIKGHLENPKVLELYPQLKPNKRINDGWTESTVILEARTKTFKEPTISCAGLDQIKVGMHYDLIIMDDLVSSRNVTTREQIEKVIEHYKLALSLLEPDGQLIIVGTRYSYGDLYGYLLKNQKDTFDHLIIPARLKPETADMLNKRFPAIVEKYGPYKAGDLLFPERLTDEFLKSQRRDQGTYIYNCQYMLEPVDAETADFKREWIKYHRSKLEINPDNGDTILVVEWIGDYNKNRQPDYEFPLRLPVTLVVTYDPNNKKKKTSNYTAAMVVAISDNNDWFILDMEHDIFNPGQIVRSICKLQERYEPDLFGLEEVGKENIQYSLSEEMRRTGKFFRITELKPRGRAKEDRIRNLIPRFEFGTIFFPPSLFKTNTYKVSENIVEALEDELMYFPSGETDDLIDALAYVDDLAALLAKKQRAKKRRKGRAKLIGARSNLPRHRIPYQERDDNIV